MGCEGQREGVRDGFKAFGLSHWKDRSYQPKVGGFGGRCRGSGHGKCEMLRRHPGRDVEAQVGLELSVPGQPGPGVRS